MKGSVQQQAVFLVRVGTVVHCIWYLNCVVRSVWCIAVVVLHRIDARVGSLNIVKYCMCLA